MKNKIAYILTGILAIGFAICLIIAVVSYSPPTPQELFWKMNTKDNYGYQVSEDKNYYQAIDSGWISQEVYTLICDLNLKEKIYGETIDKAQGVLDSMALYPLNLSFPFSLPENCSTQQIQLFLQYECDAKVKKDKEKLSYKSLYESPWDSLLIEYKTDYFHKTPFHSLSYSAFNDTIMSISMGTNAPIHEILELKYGKYSIYDEHKEKPYINYANDTSFTNDFYYTWADNNFIIRLHEKEYQHRYNKQYKYYYGSENIHNQETTISYTNRNTLHAYRDAVRQCKQRFAEQQRIQREQENIAKIRKREQELERKRQDSIYRAEKAIQNL